MYQGRYIDSSNTDIFDVEDLLLAMSKRRGSLDPVTPSFFEIVKSK